jgi:ubiquinone/menaquinone biosynthesis C-methylase UbiE
MNRSADQRAQTVQAGYDALAPVFGEWGDRIVGDPWERLLDELASRLPDGARVLDLGCGNGEKTGRLAGRFDVLAVDLSEEQLRRARASAPQTAFVQADFTELDFAAASLDAVTAFYSIVHVPRAEHLRLFERIHRWLKRGGFFLASLSHAGGPDRTETWLGVDMFFSGFDADTNSRLICAAGFELVFDDVIWMQEPEGDVAFQWVLARA